MSENPEKHARSRRRGFSSWAGGVDIVAAVGTIAGIVGVILAAIGLHDDSLTIALGIVAVVFILLLLGLQYVPLLVPGVNRERRMPRNWRRPAQRRPPLQLHLPDQGPWTHAAKRWSVP